MVKQTPFRFIEILKLIISFIKQFYIRYQTYWFFLPDNLWFNHGWIKFIEVAKTKKNIMTIDLSWMIILTNINKLAEKLQSYKKR